MKIRFRIYFRNKKVNLPAEQIKFVKELIRNYVDEILMELEVRGIKNNVVYCGGGATVVKELSRKLTGRMHHQG